MNIKTLALAAASAALATSSMAADLPVAAEPVTYVQACDAFGAGYFQLPGKETCVKLGGRIRVNYTSQDLNEDLDTANSFDAYAKGYLYFSSMTETEIGTIKTFTEYVAKWDGAGAQSHDTGDIWVQIGTSYGSFLFGREGSIFDAFTGYTSAGPASLNFSDASALQASFTADLGNGVTAAIAAQDSDYRGGEGNELDFAGALKISQGWGSFKLAAVAHNKNDGDDDYGYALGATAVFNLGMIKEGTEVTFQAQYAKDAGSYVGTSSGLVNVDEVTLYAFSGGLTHNLTDTLTAAIDASYLDADVAEDYNRTAVNTSLTYSPVSGLALSLAGGWEKEDAKGYKSDDVAKVAARVQYTF